MNVIKEASTRPGEPRTYCLDDKPFPVGQKAMRTLRLISECPMAVDMASRQIERLRRSGYVKTEGFSAAKVIAYITQAGRALLEREEAEWVRGKP